jgi:hypothetical protein
MLILVSDNGEIFYSIKEDEVSSSMVKAIQRILVDKKEGKPVEKNLFGEKPKKKVAKKLPAPPYAEIYAKAKECFPDWNFRTTTDKRNRRIRRLWNANGKSSLIFDELFKMAQASDFLNSRNGHRFKGSLSLSWIIERAEDILDGKYTNERMEWALTSGSDMVDAMIVGEGKTKIDPTQCKKVGFDEVSGLPKYIRI